MNCTQCENLFSDYLAGTLATSERETVGAHLGSCPACRELLTSIAELRAWADAFPSQMPPSWLHGRIIANTPPVVRERWRDTLVAGWRWVTAPRTAMTAFASVLILGWTLNLDAASISNLVRNPSTVYYGAQDLAYDAYDEAVRTWYGSRVVTEIYCRFEQLREATP